MRPYARSSGSVLSTAGSPMMTALPPPRSSPATAALYAMALDSARASATAASSSSYGLKRVPPRAGPSAVEQIAMMALSPLRVLAEHDLLVPG